MDIGEIMRWDREHGFRLDFTTHKNPYLGAPASYIRQIKGSYAFKSAVKEGWLTKRGMVIKEAEQKIIPTMILK